jgi:hypothetical protein
MFDMNIQQLKVLEVVASWEYFFSHWFLGSLKISVLIDLWIDFKGVDELK